MKVVIVRSDDWDGIYLDGKLHSEGHELGDGDSFLYLLRLSKSQGFDIDDVDLRWIGDGVDDDVQRNELARLGCYPIYLKDFYPMKKLYTIDDIGAAWDAAMKYVHHLHYSDGNELDGSIPDKRAYIDGIK